MSTPVIDFHVHGVPMGDIPPGFADFLKRQTGEDLAQLIARYASPQEFLRLLDNSGVRYAVVLAEVAPVTSGTVSNDFVRDFCRSSPRLIPFASVNPFMTNQPARELERLVREEGFRGLKLYPTYQYFYPNDALVYPLYAKAEELGIPVMWHTGSSVFGGARLKYGDPIYLDDVAVDFPRLTMLLSHGGRPFWYQQAFFLARLHPNVYLDLTGLPPRNLLTYFPELERIPEKLVFGSDWPGVPNIKKNVEDVQRLPLDEKTKQAILWGNAARILKLGVAAQRSEMGE